MWDGAAGLWAAVLASGLYHGLSPGMGWPLAVSAALFEGRRAALWPALLALWAGHLAAMLAVLLPFAALAWLTLWQREIRVLAALAVLALGAWLLVVRRHPRFLARVPPHRLALWSFLVAVAHGAALMLVPIYLGICSAAGLDPATAGLGAPLAVAAGHSLAVLAAGGAAAYAVHRWLGIGALRAGWLNLEGVWAASLVLVGALSLLAALG
ncbi:MAG: hypothetical protein ACU0BS_08235 [Hasllibacter sp.]